LETLSGERMKYNVGDLFISEINVVSYIVKILSKKEAKRGYNIELKSINGQRPGNITLIRPDVLDQFIKDGWKHYPVKE
jgi:hypothetical protein